MDPGRVVMGTGITITISNVTVNRTGQLFTYKVKKLFTIVEIFVKWLYLYLYFIFRLTKYLLSSIS